MESTPETRYRYGRTGESAQKSPNNDSGLQEFELQEKVEKV